MCVKFSCRKQKRKSLFQSTYRLYAEFGHCAMIFTDPKICALCDLRYLVHVDFEVAKYRRSLRNYKIPDPPGIVARNIWPKYVKHREIFRQLRNRYDFMCKQINGTVPVEQTIAGILLDVKVNKHR